VGELEARQVVHHPLVLARRQVVRGESQADDLVALKTVARQRQVRAQLW
jgi:hypothetical protein